MRLTSLLLVATIIDLSAAGSIALADPFLSLGSTTELGNLTPGQSITIDVILSDLQPGDELDFLAATVEFDASLLGTPTVDRGPIVPDPSGFATGESPGVADGFYDVFLSSTPIPSITDNGVFYRFEVVARAPGSGTIAFSFVDSDGLDGAGDLLPIVMAGPALEFTITSFVIPEPSSVVLIATGGIGLLVCFSTRRLRRPRPS